MQAASATMAPNRPRLVTKLHQLRVRLRSVRDCLLALLDRGDLQCVSELSTNHTSNAACRAYLALVESLGFDLPLLLEAVHHVLVAPADFVGETLRGKTDAFSAAVVRARAHGAP
jgi:hypothetical protein